MIAKVSIITTTYSKERLPDLKQLIDSAGVQVNQSFEMHVVVEKSDELANIIKTYIQEKTYPNIKVMCSQGIKGASANRNLALKEARGEIIAFVDDDAVLTPDWIDGIIKIFAEDSSVIGVTGPILPLWEDEAMSWLPPEFFWIISCTEMNTKKKLEIRNGYGTNLSFKREAFEAAGYFNPRLGVMGRGKLGWQEPGCEETELCIRVKHSTRKRIIFDPDVKVLHKVYAYRLKSRFIVKRAFWEGYGKALLNRKLKSIEADKDILTTEKALLLRILGGRLPRSLMLLFRDPILAIRQLFLISIVLVCVSAGYSRFKLEQIFKMGKTNESNN